MNQSGQALDEAIPARSRFEPAAIAASLVAITAAALLCYVLVASAEGWNQLLWSHTPGRLAVAVALSWVGFAVAGIVCGLVALVLPHQHRARSAIAVTLGAVSLVAVPAVAVGSLWAWAGPHHPSDDSLIDDFRQHGLQFAQAIGHYEATGSVGQLRSLGIETDGIERRPHGLVLLPVSSWGLVPSGSSKGYAYSKRPLWPVTDGGVEDYRGDEPDEIVYRHIEGPWYLFYEWW